MGNNFISYFTGFASETDATQPVDEIVPVSTEEAERKVEPLTDKQCGVAWEIDVSNWRPRGRASKTKKRRVIKDYLQEKDSNTLVGGATEVTSDETKTGSKLLKVTIPTVPAEVRIAQHYDDMKDKKVLDLKRW